MHNLTVNSTKITTDTPEQPTTCVWNFQHRK